MKLVLIGSGNTAHILGQRSMIAGHQILQVYSRDPQHAADLAAVLKTKSTSIPGDIDDTADLYLVALKDEALYQIASWLHLDPRPVAHTAGTVPMKTLEPVSSNFGVLYPLQSLRKESLQVAELPLLIDANTTANLDLLRLFAESLTNRVQVADDEYRRKIHLAAVAANNFTNYLFTLTEDFCKREKIDFQLLLPLIRETVQRLGHLSPAEVQTGPASRNDRDTIDKHLGMLTNYPELMAVYEQFTEQIISFTQKH